MQERYLLPCLKLIFHQAKRKHRGNGELGMDDDSTRSNCLPINPSKCLLTFHRVGGATSLGYHAVWDQFSSVAHPHPTLCDPMDCSTPGFPITNSRSLLKLMSIKLVMPSNHLILCRPLLLLPSTLPSIRVFANK